MSVTLRASWTRDIRFLLEGVSTAVDVSTLTDASIFVNTWRTDRRGADRGAPPSRGPEPAEAWRPLLQERLHALGEVGSAEALDHQALRLGLGGPEPGVELLVHLPLHDRQ